MSQTAGAPLTVTKSMCPMNCHPTYCGMTVTVQGDRLVSIKGDPDNADSRGFLCLRGRAAHEIPDNPKRLLRPLRRVGPRGSGQWEAISWEEALDAIAAAVRRAGLPRTALWMGHGIIPTGIARPLLNRFAHLSGAQAWAPAIVCWALGGYGLQLSGALEANTKEDMGQHSELIILWGANLASQPTTAPHLVAARKRGARVVVIDCRRTEAAAQADELVIVRPGTDAALALGMMHVLVSENLVDRAYVAEHTVGYEQLADSLSDKTPEWAAGVTGPDAETIRRLAREYATRRPAMIVLGGASMYKHAHGWQASRAVACLPALTGQYGIPGGGLGPRHRAFIKGETFANLIPPDSRPREAVMPDDMAAITAGIRDGQVGVLLLLGTNMLASFADSNTLAAALERVDLIVGHDLFQTETSRRYADIVLPGTSWLEEVGVKDTLTHVYLVDQALTPRGEARSVAATLRALAERLAIDEFFPWADQEAAVDAWLQGYDAGRLSVARLRAEGGSYAKRVSHVGYADHRYHTPSGKVEFFSQRAADLGLPPLPVYDEPSETPRSAPERAAHYPLVFRQGRTFTSFHAFYDEARALPSLAKANPAPELWLHPHDAAARGIGPADTVTLFNDRGRFHAQARVTEDVPPGVVWMRDGWVGVNQLTDGGPVLPLRASQGLPIPGGQATYEALVQVERRPEAIGSA